MNTSIYYSSKSDESKALKKRIALKSANQFTARSLFTTSIYVTCRVIDIELEFQPSQGSQGPPSTLKIDAFSVQAFSALTKFLNAPIANGFFCILPP